MQNKDTRTSTEAIREVIEAYRKTDIPISERHPKVLAALAEVEAVEKGLRSASALADVIVRAEREAPGFWDDIRREVAAAWAKVGGGHGGCRPK